jgi:hypothetical protein
MSARSVPKRTPPVAMNRIGGKSNTGERRRPQRHRWR